MNELTRFPPSIPTRVLNKKWGLLKEILKKWRDQVLTPAILHGAEIWGERAGDTRIIKKPDQEQRDALRLVVGTYKTVANCAI